MGEIVVDEVVTLKIQLWSLNFGPTLICVECARFDASILRLHHTRVFLR